MEELAHICGLEGFLHGGHGGVLVHLLDGLRPRLLPPRHPPGGAQVQHVLQVVVVVVVVVVMVVVLLL